MQNPTGSKLCVFRPSLIPQDMKLRQIVTMGSVDTLEQKTVTVCYGTDFVNVTFVNFCCTRKDIAQVSSSRENKESKSNHQQMTKWSLWVRTGTQRVFKIIS